MGARTRRLLLGATLLLSGCTREESTATSTFYERKIGPVLQGSCATSPTKSGCHVAADDRGNALGNLNIESYDALLLRRDLLLDYGPYGVPGLLLKAVPPFDLRLTYWDSDAITLRTDIVHVGGSPLDFTSSSYTQLERWIRNGAAENNAPPAPTQVELQDCSDAIGQDPEFDPGVDPPSADYPRFVQEVNPILGESCAAGNCHGSPVNSLYLTCGDSPEQQRWNYFAAGDYVSQDPSSSEILRRTLSPSQGGTFHEGGTIFETSDAAGYRAMLGWATEKGGPTNVPQDPGFEFFAKRVQPILVRRGCMMLGCHSAAMFHDYRLRGGSGGHFGLPATRQNYRLTLEQVALESPDPNASRLIRKNLRVADPPAGLGILHRGGPLLAGGGNPADCDLVAAETEDLNARTPDGDFVLQPYCVIVAWLAKEREARMANAAPFSAILYVRRPPRSGKAAPQDWAEYSPGAELVSAAASLDAGGNVTLDGAETSLSAQCGLNPAASDVRRPAVSWDGTRIAFAARTAQAEPFRIYVVQNGSCGIEPAIDAPPVDDRGTPVPNNGELVHNLDPAFSPDGQIVFVSTRGNVTNAADFSYQGTQKTPSDATKLNTNLYVLENDGKVRQLTYVLNQELSPSFMSDGRVIFVAEKRAPGFYQLAGRRINLDGGDYHPLFGQRSTVGFNQFTDVVELTDKNLAAILSDKGAAHEAGALAIINRSIGVDQLSDNPDDYLQDPSAISWPNPVFYQRAVRIIDPAATGKLAGTQGAYRNPSPLPNGRLLVSYAVNAQALDNFSGNFDVQVVDPVSGMRTQLTNGPQDELWPVAVYARQHHGVFRSRLDEANGSSRVFGGRTTAEVTYVDLGLTSSLLFQNTRTGRFIPDGPPALSIWESLPPDGDDAFNYTDQFGTMFAKRRLLGAVDVYSDSSAKIEIRGGTPIVLESTAQLASDSSATRHFQREETQFYPGEVTRQGFRRDMFNGLCGGCHGSVTGLESEIAIRVDILTRASSVEARREPPTPLLGTSGAIAGPDFP